MNIKETDAWNKNQLWGKPCLHQSIHVHWRETNINLPCPIPRLSPLPTFFLVQFLVYCRAPWAFNMLTCDMLSHAFSYVVAYWHTLLVVCQRKCQRIALSSQVARKYHKAQTTSRLPNWHPCPSQTQASCLECLESLFDNLCKCNSHFFWCYENPTITYIVIVTHHWWSSPPLWKYQTL